MGLYAIDCTSCKRPFLWFSGSLDQRCASCQVSALVSKDGPLSKSEVEYVRSHSNLLPEDLREVLIQRLARQESDPAGDQNPLMRFYQNR